MVDSDDELQAPGVVVLSHRLWQRLFHGDSGIVGRAMNV